VSKSEIDTSVSSSEDELVRAELDEARRKPRTGRARIFGTLVSVAVIAAGSRSHCRASRTSLRAVGVTHTEVTIVEAFAAWTLARILGAIPITPGGVGFVELGLTGVCWSPSVRATPRWSRGR
jgi:hypothetical protein